jgi:hypothetical protein
MNERARNIEIRQGVVGENDIDGRIETGDKFVFRFDAPAIGIEPFAGEFLDNQRRVVRIVLEQKNAKPAR